VTKFLRFRFSLATLLLATAWSAVMVWINIMPRLVDPDYLPGEFLPRLVQYGWPWCYAWTFAVCRLPVQLPNLPVELPDLGARLYWSGWSFTGDAGVGLLLVVVLTWASSQLLRRVTARLRRRTAGEQQT
jgi:hypothetical protein